jgi:hypothetical protein
MTSDRYLTRSKAVELAVAIGGGYIEMLGRGSRAAWHFLGQSDPGHSDFVFAVRPNGAVRSVRRCGTSCLKDPY